jgi:hypothetical protein
MRRLLAVLAAAQVAIAPVPAFMGPMAIGIGALVLVAVVAAAVILWRRRRRSA